MYDVPKEYRAAIRSPTRNDRMAGKLTLTDGSTIELTDSAVISGSVSVDNQCVSGQELAFGSVYMGQASLQLRTALSSAAFYDAALQIDYEIQLADGSWYTLPVGRYTVAEAERSAAVVSLTGYDNMLKLERKFSGSAILGDAYTMLTQIAETCGVVGNGAIVLHRVIVRSGGMVGANAVVLDGTEVPSGAIAVGIPAVIKPGKARPEMIASSALSYIERAAYYRSALRRLD